MTHSKACPAAPRPSALKPDVGPEVDEQVGGTWDKVRSVQPLLNEYDLNRLVNAAGHFLPAMSTGGLLGRDKTWLEVGSGIGMKTLPIADHVGAYISVELSTEQTVRAADLAHTFGIDNVHHLSANVIDVVANPERFDVPSKVDVLLLYAVLEHLLPEERWPLLNLARDILDSGGSIVVMETPNRLIPFDGHTTQIHFANMLPDDLAIAYLERSQRAEIRPPAGLNVRERREHLYRMGRGLSYHDFEIGMGLSSIDELPINIDGFDVFLLNQEPLTRQELTLTGHLQDHHLAPAPAFGRSWIEFAAGPATTRRSGRPRRHRRPDGAFEVHIDSNFWTLDAFRADGDGRHLYTGLGESSTALLLLSASMSTGCLVATDAHGRTASVIDIDDLCAARVPTWHDFVAVELPVADAYLEVAPADGDSVLHGFGLIC